MGVEKRSSDYPARGPKIGSRCCWASSFFSTLVLQAMSSPLSPGVEVSLSSIEDIKCPPQTDDTPAYFPDEDDCHVFYVCVWSKPQRMTCPGELPFDPILNVCNWAENVGCVIVDSSEEGDESSSSEEEGKAAVGDILSLFQKK